MDLLLSMLCLRNPLTSIQNLSDKGAFPKNRDYFQCRRTNSLSFAVAVFLQHPSVVAREVLIMTHMVNAIECDLFWLLFLWFLGTFLADMGCVSFAREFLVWQDPPAYLTEMSAIPFLLRHLYTSLWEIRETEIFLVLCLLGFFGLELDPGLSSSFTLHKVAGYKAMYFCIITLQNSQVPSSPPRNKIVPNGQYFSIGW